MTRRGEAVYKENRSSRARWAVLRYASPCCTVLCRVELSCYLAEILRARRSAPRAPALACIALHPDPAARASWSLCGCLHHAPHGCGWHRRP